MRRAKLAVYQDKAGGWRWRLLSSNGRIVADSGESYTRHVSAVKAALRLEDHAMEATKWQFWEHGEWRAR